MVEYRVILISFVRMALISMGPKKKEQRNAYVARADHAVSNRQETITDNYKSE